MSFIFILFHFKFQAAQFFIWHKSCMNNEWQILLNPVHFNILVIDID